MIKNVRLAELNTKIANVFLNRQTLKIISQNTNVSIVRRIIKEDLIKS